MVRVDLFFFKILANFKKMPGFPFSNIFRKQHTKELSEYKTYFNFELCHHICFVNIDNQHAF